MYCEAEPGTKLFMFVNGHVVLELSILIQFMVATKQIKIIFNFIKPREETWDPLSQTQWLEWRGAGRLKACKRALAVIS